MSGANRGSSGGRPRFASSDDDTAFYLIVSAVGLGALAYLAWSTWHAEISAFVILVLHHEIGMLDHVTDRFALADRQMLRAAPATVTIADLYGIIHALGAFLRVPASVFILLLAALCMVRAPTGRFRRRFDLDGLIREQARIFPTGSAFAERRLTLTAPAVNLRPLDYALTTEEWIGRHALRDDGAFDQDAARAALVAQLGRPWRGVDDASTHVKGLFLVFALHRAERREEAAELLGVLAASLQPDAEEPGDGPAVALTMPETMLSEIRPLLADHALVEPATLITGRHGWTQTALMALLIQARLTAGVLAPAQFAWLKLVDRPLWYALHSLGFETEGVGRYLHPNPRVEAAGPRDHWEAERIVGHALIEPSVDRAVEALRRAITPRPGSSGHSGDQEPSAPRPGGDSGQAAEHAREAAPHSVPPASVAPTSAAPEAAGPYTAAYVSVLTPTQSGRP